MAHGIWALATLRDSSDTDSRNMLIFGLALLALGAVFVWLRRRPFPMDSRYLNMVAQGLLSYEESMATFERLRVSDQIRVLRALEFMAHQASAAADDVSPAIDAAHLPSDFRPAWTPKEPGVHISTDYRTIAAPDLPGQYQYLMKLFSIADGRRRKECGDHCSHWWHNLKKE